MTERYKVTGWDLCWVWIVLFMLLVGEFFQDNTDKSLSGRIEDLESYHSDEEAKE